MTASPHLLVRVDNRPGVGAGHVLRQVALAEAWARGRGRTTFALDEPTGPLAARVEAAQRCAAGGARRLKRLIHMGRSRSGQTFVLPLRH